YIFERFHRFGVRYCINTDGPELLHTDLRRECAALRDHGILNEAQLAEADANARRASFIHAHTPDTHPATHPQSGIDHDAPSPVAFKGSFPAVRGGVNVGAPPSVWKRTQDDCALCVGAQSPGSRAPTRNAPTRIPTLEYSPATGKGRSGQPGFVPAA